LKALGAVIVVFPIRTGAWHSVEIVHASEYKSTPFRDIYAGPLRDGAGKFAVERREHKERFRWADLAARHKLTDVAFHLVPPATDHSWVDVVGALLRYSLLYCLRVLYSHPLPLETPPPLETAVFFACFFNTTDFHTS